MSSLAWRWCERYPRAECEIRLTPGDIDRQTPLPLHDPLIDPRAAKPPRLSVASSGDDARDRNLAVTSHIRHPICRAAKFGGDVGRADDVGWRGSKWSAIRPSWKVVYDFRRFDFEKPE